MKMVKSIAAGLTAAAAIGAAAAGVTSIMAGGPVVYQMQPVVFGAPLPLDPASAPDVPTAAQLTSLLNSSRSQRVVCEQGSLVEGASGHERATTS
ncbi:low molecular weight protein antigen cfp2 [Mycobacterium tuberculosis T92]|nr:low molecular weight protein antigen cfp2 [Mycobacterium tuberculosis T92]